jgi:hypothetical protein
VIISFSVAVEASSSRAEVVVAMLTLEASSSDEAVAEISLRASPEVAAEPSSVVAVGNSELSSVDTSVGTELDSEVAV